MSTLAFNCTRSAQETENPKHMYVTVMVREIGKGKAGTGV